MENKTPPEIEILNYFNQLAVKKCKPIKSNLAPIKARLKDGYTEQELKEIIQVKTLEWKNNEKMNVHLHPVTLFRESNADKYLNQIIAIKQNPQKYADHFAQLNQAPSTNDPTSAFSKIDKLFGKQ